MTAAPIRDEEIEPLLGALRAHAGLVLAVSGGPDSMALMLLVDRWRRLPGPPTPAVRIVTIDHGLRPESAAEAAWVGLQVGRLGLAHRICIWQDAKPATGLPEAAREARYRRLGEAALAFELDLAALPQSGPGAGVAIVTAHTADDQAETVLMRLARGSGVDGLAAIPPVGLYRFPAPHGAMANATVPLLRPLLGLPRARLAATLAAAGWSAITDPSNQDRRFERPRVRQALHVLAGLGIDAEPLARTAQRLRRARSALEEGARQFLATASRLQLECVVEIDMAALARTPEEIGIRVLRATIARQGGAAPAAPLDAIEAAYGRMFAKPSGRCAATPVAPFTLGGCILEVCAGTGDASGETGRLLVYREPGRHGGLASGPIAPGQVVDWDRRFLLSMTAACGTDVQFGPLGQGFADLRGQHACLARLPAPTAALVGLPAFRASGILIAVPTLARWAQACGALEAAAALAGPLARDGGLPLLEASAYGANESLPRGQP